MDRDERSLHALAPNVLDRQFTATAPNQKWVADFTYVWTHEGWLYVAVVLDLYSRRAVGWSMHPAMTTELVTDALTMAVWRRGPCAALLHHSDQGSQYTSEILSAPASRSRSHLQHESLGKRVGQLRDGSFFSSLKIERVARKTYPTRDAARTDIFDYIERFYNPTRRHSTLDYLSPMEFEKQGQVA